MANTEEDVTFGDLGLCEALVEACERMNWIKPTKIQREAIPLALGGKDVIGLAQTGSGKTGAFALPILQALLDAPPRKGIFACVLSPTRELALALQICDLFRVLGAEIGVKCAAVGTTGRVLDHINNTKGFTLGKLKYLVVDEADMLLDVGFAEELKNILKTIPRERRTFLFSATMTNKVEKLQRLSLRNPVKVEAASKYSTVDTLKQCCLPLPDKHKDCYFVQVLLEIAGSTTMVFTRTRARSQLLALTLRNLGFKAILLHGDMSQSMRTGALNMFKSGDCNILVCTDVASRGLDIPAVDVVINYDFPMNCKDYNHRVGRTARAGRSGVAISLVNQYQALRCIAVERRIGMKLPEYPIRKEEVLLHNRVCEARRLAIMNMKENGEYRRYQGEDHDRDMEKYLGLKDRKPSKNHKRTCF